MTRITPVAGQEEDEPEIVPLTAEQARALREKNPPVSPWRVIAGQIVVGLAVALAAWAVSGSRNVALSAGYGALAVVIPAAVFARGLTGRFASLNPAAAIMAFFVWEMVKIALTVAILFAAPRLVMGLSWPAMLIGLVVTMQAYWMAVAIAPGKPKQTDE